MIGVGGWWMGRSARTLLVLATCAAPEALALTLADAIAEARRSDPALAAARAEEQAARAAEQGAWSLWLPSLDARHRITRLDAETVERANSWIDFFPAPQVPGDSLGPPPESRSAGGDFDDLRVFAESHRSELELSWALFTGGSRLGALGMARGARDLANQMERIEDRRAELETRSAFLSLRRALETIAVLRANVDRVDDYRRSAATRLEVGSGTELDLLRWEVAAAAARADLAEARAAEVEARAALERLLGRALAPGESIEVLDEARDLPELRPIETGTASRVARSSEPTGKGSNSPPATRRRSAAMPLADR